MKSLLLAATMIPIIYASAQDTDDQIKDLQAQIREIRVMAESRQVGAQSPAGYPKIEDAIGLRFELGGMYQNAVLGGSEYATIYRALNDVDNPCIFSQKVYQPEAKMGWGVSGAMSYFCKEHGYEIKLRNSYYDLATSSYISVPYPIFDSAIQATSCIETCGQELFFVSANSKLDITYDLLGLELQKSFYLNRFFSVDMMGGILASWMWLTQNKKFDSMDFNIELDQYMHIRDHSYWFGIGPELGLNLNFSIGKGFSIFFNNTGALMYGKFDIEYQQTEKFYFEESEEYEVYDQYTEAADHRIIPYIQSFIGLAYELFAGDDKNFIKMRAGYNAQYFISANTMIRPDGYPFNFRINRLSENLQTQGLLFDLAWSF